MPRLESTGAVQLLGLGRPNFGPGEVPTAALVGNDASALEKRTVSAAGQECMLAVTS